MRIVAGSARGLRLEGPGKVPIRPTGDRVRQSLFNILAPVVEGQNVLDAFAGTGALGIEALSRGAGFCVFLEKDPRLLAIIERNVAHTRLADRARVIRCDVWRSIDKLRDLNLRFGLLLFDPPYQRLGSSAGWAALFDYIVALADAGLTEPGAIFVIEHRAADAPSQLPARVAITDQRKYGDTGLLMLKTSVD